MFEKNLKQVFLFIIKLFVFWMLIFVFQRVIFLFVNHNMLGDISPGHLMSAFLYGLRLDIAAACYLMFFPVLLLFAGLIVKKPLSFIKAARFLSAVLIILVLALGVMGIALHGNWGTKINSKALSLMIFPGEILGTVFNAANLLYFGFFAAFTVLIIFLFRKWMGRAKPLLLKPWLSALLLIIFTGLLFLGVRGGVQKHPVGRNSCFYSKYSVLNNAALNDFWNVADLLLSPQISENPYLFFSNKQAKLRVDKLFTCEKDSCPDILNTCRPNIILIVMESYSADAISCLGGEQGISTGFDSLAADGLLFTNFYATGFRTDQGLVSLLSCFPSQPVTSIINNFGKFDKLPNAVTEFRKHQYHTSYYFGGDLGYANTETYLTSAGVDVLTGEKDFPEGKRTDWGAYDEDSFNFHINDSASRKSPFFSMIMTITNHEFFDADVPKVFTGKTEEDKYRNTARYADQCMFEFIKKASDMPCYNNTLFVITADHAHKYPKNRNYNEPERHHIPLLFYGNVIKPEYRGETVDVIASQTDLIPTLFALLKIHPGSFRWGRNMLNPYHKGFAFYTFDNGFGIITPDEEVVYDCNLKSVLIHRKKTKSCNGDALGKGKAMLQLMFDEYIAL